MPRVAIAGYTNAGKSSLLNRLTGAGVLVENALFATLDPTVRRGRDRRRPALHPRRHGGLRPAAAAPARRGVPLDAGGGRPTPTWCCTSSTARTPTPRARSAPCARSLADVDAADVKELIVVNKADAADPEVLDRLLSPREALHRRVGPHRCGARRAASPSSPTSCPGPTSTSRCCCPTTAATWSAGCTTRPRCSPASTPSDGTHLKARVHPELASELADFAA